MVEDTPLADLLHEHYGYGVCSHCVVSFEGCGEDLGGAESCCELLLHPVSFFPFFLAILV